MAIRIQPNNTIKPRRKLALVIGIGDYENGEKLQNAENDAKEMSNTLKRIGFIIDKPNLNLTRCDMRDALSDFEKSIQPTDMVVFYFAGHGRQWNGENYLIPKDNIDIITENLRNRAINAQDIHDNIIDRNPYVTIFILDCCRTYQPSNPQSNGRAERITNSQPIGLKEMQTKAGSLIAYACAPGSIADDGKGQKNGLFTKHLLKHIITPNEDIRMVLADVTDAVINESKSKQIPYISGTLRYKNIFLYEQHPELKSPSYKNPELRQIIDKNKNQPDVKLNCKGLKDADMEIVGYYLIRNNNTLTTLHLEGNQIGPLGAKHLVDALINNTTLTTLDVGGNQIGPLGAQHLVDALINNTTLTTLHLSSNQIGDKGTHNLADALTNNTTLTTLHISSNQIGDKGAQHLADALANNTTLTTLDVGGNQIGPLGAQYLADALTNNTTLTTLHLLFNQIGDKGTQHLANALKNNTTLTTLHLYNNRIGDKGTHNLADALANNTTLTTLDVGGNQIGPFGAQYLADALTNNTTLTTLHLYNNQIGDKGTQHLADALKNHTTLTTLNLGGNQIKKQFEQQIQ